MDVDDKPDGEHMARGIGVAVVLGPIMVISGLAAAVSVGSMVVAGWIPSNWFSGNGADWLFGTGTDGDAANFFRFMVAGMIAAGCWHAIRWAFTDEAP